jgi:hypothetical protein
MRLVSFNFLLKNRCEGAVCELNVKKGTMRGTIFHTLKNRVKLYHTQYNY